MRGLTEGAAAAAAHASSASLPRALTNCVDDARFASVTDRRTLPRAANVAARMATGADAGSDGGRDGADA